MNKLIYLLFVLSASTLLFSCGNKTDKEWQAQVDSLQTALEKKTTDYQQMDEALTVISNGLDSIAMQESELFNPDRESPRLNQQEIKNALQHYKETLKTQRERIAQLEQQLNGSTDEVRKLQRVVIALKAQLVEKESQIAALQEEVNGKNFTIGKLKTHMTSLSQKTEEQQQVISMQNKIMETQDKQLNEAFVVMAEKSALKKAGLLKGGFLKKSTVDLSAVDKSMFKTIDVRVVTEIEIDAKKPTILTPMPADSYKIEKTGKKSVLHITDPERFWQSSKYLIIQTN
jgi:predicted  nucleic acid-binding Zn-ribbon protein